MSVTDEQHRPYRRPCYHLACVVCGAPPFERSKVPDIERSAYLKREVTKICPCCVPKQIVGFGRCVCGQ